MPTRNFDVVILGGGNAGMGVSDADNPTPTFIDADHGEFGTGLGIPQPRGVVLGSGQHPGAGRVEHRSPDLAFMAVQYKELGAGRGIP